MLAAVLLAALAMAMIVPHSKAAAGESLEVAVKAAYLYRFGDFVRWPPATFAKAASALNLCVTGKMPPARSFGAILAGKHVGGRPLVVRRLATVTRASDCQILYIAGADRQRIAAILAVVEGAGVLTVTDVLDAGTMASVISFVIQDDHVRFAINARAAARNRLVISSKLLSLALAVSDRK
ncbi:MAG: YfiR family protein [Stellaceae bacterium]